MSATIRKLEQPESKPSWVRAEKEEMARSRRALERGRPYAVAVVSLFGLGLLVTAVFLLFVHPQGATPDLIERRELMGGSLFRLVASFAFTFTTVMVLFGSPRERRSPLVDGLLLWAVVGALGMALIGFALALSAAMTTDWREAARTGRLLLSVAFGSTFLISSGANVLATWTRGRRDASGAETREAVPSE
ncbi:MAG: hypothetical protein RL885_23560 [Planctomycetota bacterium]